MFIRVNARNHSRVVGPRDGWVDCVHSCPCAVPNEPSQVGNRFFWIFQCKPGKSIKADQNDHAIPGRDLHLCRESRHGTEKNDEGEKAFYHKHGEGGPVTGFALRQ